MDDLVTFIEERLDEDQRDFEAALELYQGPPVAGSELSNYEWCRRMLRGVEAKRRIVDEHREDPTLPGTCRVGCIEPARYIESGPDAREESQMVWPCLTLRLLATEWSTREVYLANREKWQP